MWSNKGRSEPFWTISLRQTHKILAAMAERAAPRFFLLQLLLLLLRRRPLPTVGVPLFPFPLPGYRLLPGGTDTRPLPLFRWIWPGFACKTVAISARVWYDNRNFLHPAQPPPVHFGLFPAARSPASSGKRAEAGTAAHSRPWPPGSANPCRAGRPAAGGALPIRVYPPARPHRHRMRAGRPFPRPRRA